MKLMFNVSIDPRDLGNVSIKDNTVKKRMFQIALFNDFDIKIVCVKVSSPVAMIKQPLYRTSENPDQ